MIIKNCDSHTFIKNLNGRKVICFGAGSMLNNNVLLTGGTINKLEDYIGFLIDNDCNKIGLEYEYNNKKFKINGTDIFDKIDVSKYVLLVTCYDVINVYNQLQEISSIKDLECYFYIMILNFHSVDIKNFLENEVKKDSYLKSSQILSQYKKIYTGKRCFIIGNGPSLKSDDLDILKNEITFAANRIYLMFNKTDWRPTNYICTDYKEFNVDYDIINNLNITNKFVGITAMFAAGKISENIKCFKTLADKTCVVNGKIENKSLCSFSYDITEGIHSGGTVLYVAVQMAVYMGVKEIYLLGVDCNYSHELLPDGTCKLNDVDDYFCEEASIGFETMLSKGVSTYEMQKAWQSAKEACEKVGVTIKNATRGGKLEVFERVNFDELF